MSAPTFSAILESAIDAGSITRKSLAFAAECSEETVRRWISGQTPDLEHVRLLLGSALPPVLLNEIADWFFRRTPFKAIRRDGHAATILDTNGDRIIDANDVTAFAVATTDKAVEAIKACRVAWQDGKLNEAEKATVRATLVEAREQINCAIEANDYEGPRLRVG